MDTLLYVSILLVILHLTPPAGVIQLQDPGFETQETCLAWLEIKENRDEISQNVLVTFGPWAEIKGVACMTERDAKDLNKKWGHGLPKKGNDNFLKQFDGGEA